MVHRREIHAVIVNTRSLCCAGIEPRRRGGHIKNLHHAGTERTAIHAVPAADVVRRDAPLPVGRSRQRDTRRFAGHAVLHLRRVTDGVNIRLACTHMRIYNDAPLFAERKSRFGGKLCIRLNADGDHRHIRRKRRRVIRQHANAVCICGHILHGMPEDQAHACAAHMRVHKRRHVRVQRRQKLMPALHERYLKPLPQQVLRKLQADISAARNHHGTRIIFSYILVDTQCILYGAKRKHPLGQRIREPQPYGPRPGGKHQLIVGFRKRFSRFQVTHGHRLALRVDCRHLVVHTHIHIETCPEALRRLQGQFRFILDHAADIIGQPAVRIRNKARALKHNDLCRFIQSPQPRGGGRAACNAADNNNLHTFTSPNFPKAGPGGINVSLIPSFPKSALWAVRPPIAGRSCRLSRPSASGCS